MIGPLLLANGLFLVCWVVFWPIYPYRLLFSVLGCLLLIGLSYYRFHRKQGRLIKSLYDGLTSFSDNNFSVNLPEEFFPKYSAIITVFNTLAEKLRRERQTLHQRELILDKVVNSANVVTILINNKNKVVFHNHAAVAFFRIGHSLNGSDWQALQADYLPEFKDQTLKNAILSIKNGHSNDSHNSNELWHCSRSSLTFNHQSHQLFLLKPITEELARQELQTWKKAIRVVSHELNNSIAPISTMCHSGKILSDRLNDPQLERVFQSISRRVMRLSNFVKSYGDMAKVSTPKKSEINIIDLLKNIYPLYSFIWNASQDEKFLESGVYINADPVQLEQVMINLLKNAHEASSNTPVSVVVEVSKTEVSVAIRDEGPGIEPLVLHRALLPFYSTKKEGSGIGLAICREVVESHYGHLELKNRHQGGLQVKVRLPR